jgi:polar amino acid transport system substrate-binding protein
MARGRLWRFGQRLRLLSLAVGWLLVGLHNAQASVLEKPLLRVCVADIDLPPMSFVDHDGQAQYLIRQAAAVQGWAVEFTPVPVRRCLLEVASGRYDAVAPVTATSSNQAAMAFPLLAGKLNERHALSESTAVVFRVAGSNASWDGQRFTGLNTPVLYYAGARAPAERLQSLGVSGNDSAKGTHQMVEMLLHGRAQLAIGLDAAVQLELQKPEFAGRIEVLPQPFIRAHTFLALNQQFYAEHKASMDAVWAGIEQLRAAPEWPARAAEVAQ